MDVRKQTGHDGETAAASFLQKKGVRILLTNYRCRFGEIDIIGSVVEHGETYFVAFEVKTRKNERAGSGTEAVDLRKQRKICRTFDYFRMQYRLPEETPARFDVVEVDRSLNCTWYQNAFDYS